MQYHIEARNEYDGNDVYGSPASIVSHFLTSDCKDDTKCIILSKLELCPRREVISIAMLVFYEDTSVHFDSYINSSLITARERERGRL
jgi:hypothetical protein